MSIPPIGSKIWASVVQRGMIIRTSSGTQIEVDQIIERYDTWSFVGFAGLMTTVDYADLVEVLGYFNP